MNGYTCAEAPINSNVVPARDEYYRQNETHVPLKYKNQCQADPNGLPPNCEAAICKDECPRSVLLRSPPSVMWLPIGIAAALIYLMLKGFPKA